MKDSRAEAQMKVSPKVVFTSTPKRHRLFFFWLYSDSTTKHESFGDSTHWELQDCTTILYPKKLLSITCGVDPLIKIKV